MARQTLLTREHPPRLWAVIDEAAMRRPVGGREVMRGQLERLIEAAKLPNVTLQVLPFGAGAHPAMVGSFSVLRFPDEELPDVVYLEHLTSALYLNKPEEVDHYLHVMETICVRAAPPDQTVELLDAILDELWAPSAGEVVEIAALHPFEEGVELGVGEDQRRALRVAGVADRDPSPRQPGQLDAVPLGTAAGTLAPPRPGGLRGGRG